MTDSNLYIGVCATISFLGIVSIYIGIFHMINNHAIAPVFGISGFLLFFIGLVSPALYPFDTKTARSVIVVNGVPVHLSDECKSDLS